MEISNLDAAIRDSIQAINAGTTKNPSYCGWALAMRTRENIIFKSIVSGYPSLIQYIEDKEQTLPNGMVEKTIDFYMINPKTDDTLETRAIHDRLNSIVQEFRENLSAYYKCEFVNYRERLIEQLSTVKEAGIVFTLKIIVDEC